MPKGSQTLKNPGTHGRERRARGQVQEGPTASLELGLCGNECSQHSCLLSQTYYPDHGVGAPDTEGLGWAGLDSQQACVPGPILMCALAWEISERQKTIVSFHCSVYEEGIILSAFPPSKILVLLVCHSFPVLLRYH